MQDHLSREGSPDAAPSNAPRSRMTKQLRSQVGAVGESGFAAEAGSRGNRGLVPRSVSMLRMQPWLLAAVVLGVAVLGTIALKVIGPSGKTDTAMGEPNPNFDPIEVRKDLGQSDLSRAPWPSSPEMRAPSMSSDEQIRSRLVKTAEDYSAESDRPVLRSPEHGLSRLGIGPHQGSEFEGGGLAQSSPQTRTTHSGRGAWLSGTIEEPPEAHRRAWRSDPFIGSRQ